jgi:hypothetical protein
MASEGSVKVGRFSGSGEINHAYNEDYAGRNTSDANATALAATILPVVSTIVSGESRQCAKNQGAEQKMCYMDLART